MEVTKRTYQKHKTEKKITVKHFLNTSIKEYDDFGNELYPVYIQVTYNRKTTKFRSQIPPSLDKFLDLTPNFDNDKESEEYHLRMGINMFEDAMIGDVNLIKWLISEYKGEFDINELPKLYHKKFYSITFFVEWCLMQEIQLAIFNSKAVKFKYDESAPEYSYDEINQIVPIFNSISALNHFEFYVANYPFINFIKEKYPSNIWNLGIYVGVMTNNSLAGSYWNFGTFENTYAVYNIEPTINDYIERRFQSHFLNCFNDEQFAKDILVDIEKLYLEHFEKFKEVFIEKRWSKNFDKLPIKESSQF